MKYDDLIINSMLWAAYGDALGFITEFSDRKNLKYRTNGQDKVTRLLNWKRKIGGRYGISIALPSGCYSDDTQLRLAVCRSINKNGKFDFETFSKIELPVFLAYGLGKGKGTKAACESLKKKSIQWNTNFFATKETQYVDMGGNGVAMRIQPHVYVSFNKLSEEELISEILRDAIITHGNPIAWLGALFHAFILHDTLKHGKCPTIDDWESILTRIKSLVYVCKTDDLLKNVWLPNWERIANQRLEAAIDTASQVMLKDIGMIKSLLFNISDKPLDEYETFYHSIVKSIDALNPKLSGSAIKTSLLSSFIAFYFSDIPLEGLKICINTFGSDTDSIATMAGALFGACNVTQPPEKVLDHDYILAQAKRLNSIRNNLPVQHFLYPDLLHWQLPTSNLDLVGSYNNKMFVYGLGEVNPSNDKVIQKQKDNISVWQFAKTSFGQTILLNHRENLKSIPMQSLPLAEQTPNSLILEKAESKKIITHMKSHNIKLDNENLFSQSKSINELTDEIIKNGFNENEIGAQLLKYAQEEDGIEKAVSFTSILIKAKMARLKKDRQNKSI